MKYIPPEWIGVAIKLTPVTVLDERTFVQGEAMIEATIQDRVRVLCTALGMTPSSSGAHIVKDSADGRWWLLGCVEGDQPLPMTKGAISVRDALDHAEAWLAPEINCAIKHDVLGMNGKSPNRDNDAYAENCKWIKRGP